jgi:hypothetical protein
VSAAFSSLNIIPSPPLEPIQGMAYAYAFFGVLLNVRERII